MNPVPQKTSDSFVLNAKTKQLDPLNLLATDRVKCLNCSQYVQIMRLQQHLEHHSRKSTLNTTQKAPANNTPINTIAYVNHNYNYIEPIDIKTFNSEQIPSRETKKKSVSQPKHSNLEISMSKPISLMQIGNSVRKQSQNTIDNTQQFPTIKQTILKGDYFEEAKLNLSASVVKINRRSVSYFKNRTYVMENDNHVEYEIKNPQQFKDKIRKSNYSIITSSQINSTQKINQKNSSLQKQKRQPIIVDVPDNRLLVTPIKKLTSTKNSSIITPQKQSTTPSTFISSNVHNKNFTCPTCGGFYCPHCKSTVNPQFRKPKIFYKQEQSTLFKSRTN